MISSTKKKSGYDHLMTNVLATQVQDYINAKEITNYPLQEEIAKISKRIKTLNKKIGKVGIKKSKSLDEMIANIEKEVKLFLLCEKLNKISNRKTLLGHGEEARRYIFEDIQPVFEVNDIKKWDKEKKKYVLDKKISSKIIGYEKSDEHVFGFKFICKYLGLDPTRFREKIKELKKKQIKEIQARIKDY